MKISLVVFRLKLCSSVLFMNRVDISIFSMVNLFMKVVIIVGVLLWILLMFLLICIVLEDVVVKVSVVNSVESSYSRGEWSCLCSLKWKKVVIMGVFWLGGL